MYTFSWRTIFSWTYVLRFVVLIFGLFLYSTGIVCLYRSSFGLDPWDVLHQGISLHSPLSFGLANVAVGATLIVICLFLKVIPGVGTVCNMLLIGLFVDAQIRLNWLPDLSHASLLVRFLVNVLGVLVIGFGTACYIAPHMGAGPRDGLMLRLHTLTKLRIWIVRAIIECSVLLIGFLLGGTVGLGTIIFAAGIGPAVEISINLLNKMRITERLVPPVETSTPATASELDQIQSTAENPC
ncbi:membrane protein [Dictyobacter alpinus]|uniref:Membrane protein n=1 Tax=Dictyobacter alpinus TaxID=2014873 RepID=A0A402BGN2_9CHLR|nr:hypothetical protein [Dictyobacter alpinus]GCE30588.1 membrane protein [Dictyobacter alpinus]